jgi:hypothetical protein
MLSGFAEQEDRREQNRFRVTTAHALAVLENVDLVVGDLDGDAFGLKQEEILSVSVDETISFSRKCGDRSADVCHVIPVIRGKHAKAQ